MQSVRLLSRHSLVVVVIVVSEAAVILVYVKLHLGLGSLE